MRNRYFTPFLLLLFLACGKTGEPAKTGPMIGADSIAVREVRDVMGIAMIEPGARLTALASEASGIVRQLFAQPGQALKAGQPILALDAAVENAQLRQASSKRATQRNAVQGAEANLDLLRLQLDKARADLRRDESLHAGNAITLQALENSRFQVSDLEQQVRAQEALIRQQQSKTGELQADIRYFQTLLTRKTVRAPANGTLLSLEVHPGEFVDANAAIGDFAPDGPVIALTEIDELFAGRIRVGQKAVIRPQGKSDTLTTGTVVLTSPYLRKKSLFSDKPDDLEDRRVREVRVQLDDPSKLLLGSRVECVIAVQ